MLKMEKIKKLVLKPTQMLQEEEMEKLVAGCFSVDGSDDLLLNLFADVCNCRKSGDCHHEYAVFKIAKDGVPVTKDDSDYFYGHPAGSPIDDNDMNRAKYREIDMLMRYYKITIPGINGGYEHVKESTTTRYYE